MPFFAIFGGLAALIVIWEPLFQILAKLLIWGLMWNTMGMTIKADVNYVYERLGWERPYVLPLDKEVLLMQTPVQYQTTPGAVTRDDQGRITGFGFTVEGRLTNNTGRTLDGAEFLCRWRNHPEDDDRMANLTVSLSVPAGQTGTFRQSFKTKDDRAPTDMQDFLANHRYNCRLTGVTEVKQKDWP